MTDEPTSYEHLKGGVPKGLSDGQLDLPVEQHLLVVPDDWEHAFMLDDGSKRPDNINAFLENLQWSEVSRRFGNLSDRDQRWGTEDRRGRCPERAA